MFMNNIGRARALIVLNLKIKTDREIHILRLQPFPVC